MLSTRVLILLSWLSLALSQDTCPCDQGISNALDDLEAGIKALEDARETGLKMVETFGWRVNALVDDLDKMEGSGCQPFKEFQCGHPERQCIVDFLVCDGVPDCNNGRDEEICKLPFEKTSRWMTTAMPFYNCLKWDPMADPVPGPDSDLIFDIVDDPILPSRPALKGRWKVKLASGLDWIWFMDGFYSYSNRKFVTWWHYPMWYGHGQMTFNPETEVLSADIIAQNFVKAEGNRVCGLYLWEPRDKYVKEEDMTPALARYHDLSGYNIYAREFGV